MTKEQLFKAMAGIDEERLEHSERRKERSFLWVYRGTAAVFACVILLAVTKFFPRILQNTITSTTGILEESDRVATAGGSGGAKSSGLEEKERVSKEDEIFLESAKVMEDGFWLNGAKYMPISYEEIQHDEWEKEGAEESAYLPSQPAGQEDLELSTLIFPRYESAVQGIGQEDLEGTARSSGKIEKDSDLENAQEETSFYGEYSITERDLGEIMGVIEECEEKELIGCMVYHYASYPDSDRICIVKRKDSYQFYRMEGSVLE